VKRFYTDVTIADDLSIHLDGKPILTPAKRKLALPTRQLADAIAQEWREQGEDIVPATMHLTKLANTAIDGARRDDIVAELTNFARNDLLCYRASEPDELVARQQAAWDPLLVWINTTYGARLATTHGVRHVAQDDAGISTLSRSLNSEDAWTLTAMHAATTITGSFVLALAIAKRRVTAAEAFALSRIDEKFQVEKWGLDPEAEARARRLATELERAAQFMALAGP
jgi:chaperone required for assembly of F1-ATPase